MLDPLLAAHRLLPAENLQAAGIFGIQDKGLASGLLGMTALMNTSGGLVREATTDQLRQAAAWLSVTVMVAVSAAGIHVCSWEERFGSSLELARFDRLATRIKVDSHRTGRRLLLTDLRTGYELPLTATVSRLSPYGSGARRVLAAVDVA
jgi:hypothetical protein